MLLSIPPESEYDLHFNVGPFPVRVHPLFWLISAVFGALGGGGPTEVAIWVVVVFFSILIHELGHAVAIYYYGWQPHIILYGMGGLAVYTPTRNNPMQQIVISFAGPLADFVLAGLVWVVLRFGEFALLDNRIAMLAIGYLLFINIFWGLLNLVPVIPLDGGNIMKNVLVRFFPWSNTMLPFQISIVTAVAVALGAWMYLNSIFLPVMFAALAIQNYQVLEMYGSGPRGPFRY